MRAADDPIYYQASGKVARSSGLIAPACGLAALPAACLYAWVCTQAPALVRLLALLFFTWSIALIVDWAAYRARVRSRAWITRFALALAVCAWCLQWALWLSLAPGQTWPALLAASFDAGAWLTVWLNAARHNPWGVQPAVMAGAWLLELGLLLYCAPMLGRKRAGQPYCEVSDRWAGVQVLARRFAVVAEVEAVVRQLERAPQQLAAVLAPCAQDAAAFTELTLHRCHGALAYVSLSHVVIETGKHGSSRKARALLTALRLPQVDPDALVRALIARADAPVHQDQEQNQDPDQNQNQNQPGRPLLAPQLASALALFQAARFGDALARARLFRGASDRPLRMDANRLCALSCVRQRRWDEAIGYWHALFDDGASAATALQLAGTCVMAGALQDGHGWFQRARALNAASVELPALTLLTVFVSALDMAGHPDAAMPWLDEIRDSYCTGSVTDPAVLMAQQMPLFHAFLDRSAPIVFAALGPAPGLRWFAAMLGHLDDAGNAALRQWLDEQARSIVR